MYCNALIALLFLSIIYSIQCERPHIVLITVEELGFGDIGFHGGDSLRTPNIDALAYSGLILTNYYVYSSPILSFKALMTGELPHSTSSRPAAKEARSTEESMIYMKLLPQYLKEFGYSNHLIGRWYLNEEIEPSRKGYDSCHGYQTKMHVMGDNQMEIFTQNAVNIIQNHNKSKPLFLNIAINNKHILEQNYFITTKYSKKYASAGECDIRTKFSILMAQFDDFIGEIVIALDKRNMLFDNTVIIFTSTSGALNNHDEGKNFNFSSNYPLKGGRESPWEGGIRGAAFIWSPLIAKSSRIADQNMHIIDWLPTILDLCFLNSRKLESPDSFSMWLPLFFNKTSPRIETLNYIKKDAGAITKTNWKLIRGGTYDGKYDGWSEAPYKVPSHSYDYNSSILDSSVSQILRKDNRFELAPNQIQDLRMKTRIVCGSRPNNSEPCVPDDLPCLFNLVTDPCEFYNVAVYENNKEIVKELSDKLEWYHSTIYSLKDDIPAYDEEKLKQKYFIKRVDYRKGDQGSISAEVGTYRGPYINDGVTETGLWWKIYNFCSGGVSSFLLGSLDFLKFW